MAGKGDAQSSAELAVKHDSWSKVCGQAARRLRPKVRRWRWTMNGPITLGSSVVFTNADYTGFNLTPACQAQSPGAGLPGLIFASGWPSRLVPTAEEDRLNISPAN